jgi:Cd(II)/Pb(II)-responsive transcriptional regulator
MSFSSVGQSIDGMCSTVEPAWPVEAGTADNDSGVLQLPVHAQLACWVGTALSTIGLAIKLSLCADIENLVATKESRGYSHGIGSMLSKPQRVIQIGVMKISEIARDTGTHVETIRYYEREGLLPETARTEGNYRIYGDAHAERLLFIRNCRSLDMTLDEIRVLLKFKDTPSQDCGAVNDLLDEHIGHVASRIGILRQLESQLKELRELCRETSIAGSCGILNELSRQSPRKEKTESTVGVHVRRTHR